MIGTTQKRGKEGAVVNILTSNSMLMLQRSMGFLWSKQDCILNNLANAETPGYKTQYVTFEESLRDAVQAAADKPQPGAAMRVTQFLNNSVPQFLLNLNSERRIHSVWK